MKLLICELIIFILVVVLIFIWVRFLYPYRMLSKTIRRFNETKDIMEWRRFSVKRWPEIHKFIDFIIEEMEFGTLSELKQKHAEYLALQNQINPHFLFNTLEDIRGDALEAGMRGIAQTTGALATYFRYTITELDNMVRLEDELDNVENYYTIQKYRFGNRFTMSIEYPDEHLGFPNVSLPKLTLQPIVENAISHGLEGMRRDGILQIKIDTTQKDLVIHVKDNGKGIEPEQVKKMNESLRANRKNIIEANDDDYGKTHNGIALFNINNRIRLLFGENYGLHVYSMIGVGTDVCVRIPLIQNRETETNEERDFEI